MNHSFDTGGLSGARDPSSGIGIDGFQALGAVAEQDARCIDHCPSPLHRLSNIAVIVDIALDDINLADFTGDQEKIPEIWLAANRTYAQAPPSERQDSVTANKPRSAKHRNDIIGHTRLPFKRFQKEPISGKSAAG
jgi:hypothetical protein